MKKIEIGDIVFIRCWDTGKPRYETGVCLVISQSVGYPGDGSLVRKDNPKPIFSILWNGIVDDLVDPEWLIQAEAPISLVLAESD